MLLAWLSALLGRLVTLARGRDLNQLTRLELLYSGHTDEALRAELARLADQPASRSKLRPEDDPVLLSLAIACCLFERHPCDLPDGSRLYEEQRTAALALADGLVVQMDTGEGKTYAVAVAAVSQLAKRRMVIVVTANEYLARRDCGRVSSFVAASGFECRTGVPDREFRGVAYTTLTELAFSYLDRAYVAPKTLSPYLDYPVDAAVFIDEIDSVLLDQGGSFAKVREVGLDESIWADVFGLVSSWGEEEFDFEPVTEEVSLTESAYRQVSTLSESTSVPVAQLLELADGALWAIRAVEGAHFIHDDGAIKLIDVVTGQPVVQHGVRARALEFHRLARSPNIAVPVSRIDAVQLLLRHPFVTGTSGSAQDELLYFVQTLNAMTVIVPPRFERHPGDVMTWLSSSRENTLAHVVSRVIEVAPRPVVVGTWSPQAAHAVAATLRAQPELADHEINVIRNFSSDTDDAILRHAGELRRITVLSQGGSRGVDVRSSNRPLLLVLGRAWEPRLDRQFLGRVGRHGEPFDAEFVVDPDGPLTFPGIKVAASLGGGLLPVKKGSQTARALRQGQRQAWMLRVRRRQRQGLHSRTLARIEAETAAEFARVRALSDQDAVNDFVDAFADAGAIPLDIAARAKEAVGRRVQLDAAVGSVEAGHRSLAAAFEASSGFEAEPRHVLGVLPPEDEDEIPEILAWLERAERRMPIVDDAERDMLLAQAATVVEQQLKASTHPRIRSVAGIVYETYLMANADFLTRVDRRTDLLRVSQPGELFHRKASYVAKTLHQLRESQLAGATVDNLSRADTPDRLDDLYFTADHQRFERPPPQEQTITAAPPAASVPPVATRSQAELEAELDAIVTAYLADEDSGPAALGATHQRLLLLAVAKPLLRGTPPTAQAAQRHVEAFLSSLSAAGTHKAALRSDERLIHQFMDHLFEVGVLHERTPRTSRGLRAWRRTREFAGTVPRVGVLALVAHLFAVVLAGLAARAPAQSWDSLSTVSQVFGFGSWLPDRPALMLLAVILTAHCLARACGIHLDLLPTVGSALLALTLAFALYVDGVSSLPIALALALLLLLWRTAYALTHRLVVTLVGFDSLLILGAASVLVYLVEGEVWVLPFVLVGVASEWLRGPRLAVHVARRGGLANESDGDETTQLTVRLDPYLTSAIVGAAGGLLVGGGEAGVIGFAVAQLVAFTALALRSTSRVQVVRQLARLRVGADLEADAVRRSVRWGQLVGVLLCGLLLAAGVASARRSGVTDTWQVLLSELGGVVLVMGFFGLVRSVKVDASYSYRPASEESSWSLVKENFRAWRRFRYARVAEVVVGCLVTVRFVADWSDIIGVLGSAVEFVRGLF